MRERFHSWWQQIRKHPFIVAGIIVVSVLLFALIVVEVRANGTGFSGKTLWDWLQLLAALAIPVVVGFGAVWFTTRQGKVADAENTDNQREAALQTYIDKMSELLLEKNLRESAEDNEVRTIARVRTLTVLYRLDVIRKCGLLQFLYESGLINKGKCIVNLSRADLSGVDTRKAVLNGANLCEADLEMANLREADLSRADLSRANLSRADLSGADLSRTDLSGAIGTTPEQLDKAKSLKGATMPDGSKHT